MHSRRMLIRCATAAAAVLLLGAALEAGTRWYHHYKIGPYSTYEPRHLVDFYRFYRVNPAYRSRTVRVDSAGFRNDEEIEPEKPSGVYRIVMMGGSTVWGEDAGGPFSGSIDNHDTIAAHLEAALNDRAGVRHLPLHVQVVNAGVVGYLLFQNVIYFDTRIADFHPDLVIAMDGHNDLDALQFGVPEYRHRNDGTFDRAENDPGVLDVMGQIVHYGERKSQFVRALSSKVIETVSSRALQSQPWKDQFLNHPVASALERWLDHYVTNVRRLDSSSRIAGAKTLFTVQLEVAGERLKPLTPTEQRIYDYYSYYRWLHTTVRDRLIARMNRLAADNGIWFVDVSDVFRGERGQTYLDYTHLTDRGAALMAEKLTSIVEREVFANVAAGQLEERNGPGDLTTPDSRGHVLSIQKEGVTQQ